MVRCSKQLQHLLFLESSERVLCYLLKLDAGSKVGLQIAFVVEEPEEALECPGTYVYSCRGQAYVGVVAFKRRVSGVQGLFGQHVLYILANVVGGQFFKLERRILSRQPALKVAIVAFVIVQRPRLQALRFLGSEKQGKVIIKRMM